MGTSLAAFLFCFVVSLLCAGVGLGSTERYLPRRGLRFSHFIVSPAASRLLSPIPAASATPVVAPRSWRLITHRAGWVGSHQNGGRGGGLICVATSTTAASRDDHAHTYPRPGEVVVEGREAARLTTRRPSAASARAARPRARHRNGRSLKAGGGGGRPWGTASARPQPPWGSASVAKAGAPGHAPRPPPAAPPHP